jgi:hypothetical protein
VHAPSQLVPHLPELGSHAVPPGLPREQEAVPAKRPFGGPEAVLAYLSRYTHPVAIANSSMRSNTASPNAFASFRA